MKKIIIILTILVIVGCRDNSIGDSSDIKMVIVGDFIYYY